MRVWSLKMCWVAYSNARGIVSMDARWKPCAMGATNPRSPSAAFDGRYTVGLSYTSRLRQIHAFEKNKKLSQTATPNKYATPVNLLASNPLPSCTSLSILYCSSTQIGDFVCLLTRSVDLLYSIVLDHLCAALGCPHGVLSMRSRCL